jgi:hypothetical protein
MKHLQNKKGQGTLEYVVIAAVVIALAIALKNVMKPSMDTKIAAIGTQLNQ